MAGRASRDPAALLRAHFAEQIAAARLLSPPPPELAEARRAQGRGGIENPPRASRSPPGRARARLPELAAAAGIVLALGLGLVAAPDETALSRAIAASVSGGGSVLEAGASIGDGFSAAISAFGRSVRAGTGGGAAQLNTRFK